MATRNMNDKIVKRKQKTGYIVCVPENVWIKEGLSL